MKDTVQSGKRLARSLAEHGVRDRIDQRSRMKALASAGQRLPMEHDLSVLGHTKTRRTGGDEHMELPAAKHEDTQKGEERQA